MLLNGVEPVQGRGEAQGGVVVAGSLVGAHRDAAPLLELVEAALDDVAASVALLLVLPEVDRVWRREPSPGKRTWAVRGLRHAGCQPVIMPARR